MAGDARRSRPVSVLTIAGSDSGGGAGIQADLKTFAAHGVHGLSAIAALTAQHTRGVSAVHVPPEAFLVEQMEACFDDFDIGAVKLGMLATAGVIAAVAGVLERHAPRCIVVDPVMIATSGAKLLADDALDAVRTRLLPLATLITPNIPEAELLLGRTITARDASEAAAELHGHGADAVLLKGGHLPGDPVIDRLHTGNGLHCFSHPRLDIDGHGTGCTLASAVAANLACGLALPAACAAAADYVHGALQASARPGRGEVAVLDHFWQWRPAGGPGAAH